MYHSLLVPLDGSTFGEHALPLALSIARRAGATLTVLHVYAPLAAMDAASPLVFDERLERHLKEQQQAYLDSVVQRVRDVSPVPVHSELLEGETADVIRTAVSSTGVDLVVMTTHGRGPLGRFWLGSMADELVRQLPAPLLLLRPGEGDPDYQQEPVWKRVLLPLDGSALAEQMIEPAVALGSLMGAQYTLLRVIKPVLTPAVPMGGVGLTEQVEALLKQMETRQESLRQQAQHYLGQVADRLRARSLDVQIKIAVEEQPAIAILHEAKSSAVDLIALETHGRRGLSRLVVGSVADKVVRGASVPVLVHRPVYA
jgi:nucleotide-binding universal stress UspA family protein